MSVHQSHFTVSDRCFEEWVNCCPLPFFTSVRKELTVLLEARSWLLCVCPELQTQHPLTIMSHCLATSGLTEWQLSVQAKLWLFLFSPRRCELLLSTLPVKPDVAYRGHIFSFSALAQGALCSARLVFSPACLTSHTLGLPASGLLKGGSSKATSSDGPLKRDAAN